MTCGGWLRGKMWFLHYSYDSEALSHVLTDVLGDRKLGSAKTRLCIPSFEGEYVEVFVFKTPYQPAFKKYLYEAQGKRSSSLLRLRRPTCGRIATVGTLLLRGRLGKQPIMIAVTEALTSFDVSRDQIRILSIDCGDDPDRVSARKF